MSFLLLFHQVSCNKVTVDAQTVSMASNLSQLFLLADHIKLCLLERQRAISQKLEPTTQDAEMSTSLDSLRDGIETLEAQQ